MNEDQPAERSTVDELIARLHEMVARLQAEQAETLPSDEPYLASGSAVKGGLKRGVFRLTRPATRRYDRLTTELAAVAIELAEHMDATSAEVERLRGDVEHIERGLQAAWATAAKATASAQTVGRPTSVPDDYYWAFESRMRGTSSSVVERLRQYERLLVPLRERLMQTATATGEGEGEGEAEPPLWLDLGCGFGELCELVREWGWRVQGIDNSPAAVEACQSKGIDAIEADIGIYLETWRGQGPAGVSAIQLIEHLDPGRWIGLFERICAVLQPGGALLVETINGLNPEAVAAYFIADVTHTWPGHPETLALMAEHAGFERVEVIFANPDARGNAQDFAIWAVKAAAQTQGA